MRDARPGRSRKLGAEFVQERPQFLDFLRHLLGQIVPLLNVLGLILTTQEALNYFGPAGGSIVNISSVVSTLSPAGNAVYNATKSAVDGLTRTFAKELGLRKIRVNSVNPGPIETEGTRSAGMADRFQTYATVTPLGRIGQPEDIAPAVVFLVSPDSGWITGETLYVSGGLR